MCNVIATNLLCNLLMQKLKEGYLTKAPDLTKGTSGLKVKRMQLCFYIYVCIYKYSQCAFVCMCAYVYMHVQVCEHMCVALWRRPCRAMGGTLCWSCKPTMGIHHACIPYNRRKWCLCHMMLVGVRSRSKPNFCYYPWLPTLLEI